jgi:hypothetical protein
LPHEAAAAAALVLKSPGPVCEGERREDGELERDVQVEEKRCLVRQSFHGRTKTHKTHHQGSETETGKQRVYVCRSVRIVECLQVLVAELQQAVGRGDGGRGGGTCRRGWEEQEEKSCNGCE